MADIKKEFRATLFLDEHFGFLHDTEEDDQKTDDQQTDAQVNSETHGGPSCITESDAEGDADKGQVNGTARSSLASSCTSSRQSDGSQHMNLRSSSVSESSRDSTTGDQSTNKSAQEFQEYKNVAGNITVPAAVSSDKAYYDSNDESKQENIQDEDSHISKENSNGEDNNKDTETTVGHSKDMDNTVKDENINDSIESSSDPSKGGRISLFIRNEFDFLNNVSDNESDTTVEESEGDSKVDADCINQKQNSELNTQQELKDSNQNTDHCSSTECSLKTKSECETRNINSQSASNVSAADGHSNNTNNVDKITESEINTKEINNVDKITELEINTKEINLKNSGEEIIGPSNIDRSSKVVRRDKTSVERLADTAFFDVTFKFLDDKSVIGNNSDDNNDNDCGESNDVKDIIIMGSELPASNSKCELTGVPTSVTSTSNSKSVLTYVRNNDPSSSSVSERPKSPLLDRVKNSEASVMANSKSGSSTSSSRSSFDLDTDNSEVESEKPVFEDLKSQTLPRTAYEQKAPLSGHNRSLSVSTTLSESEFKREYQERVVQIDRPYIKKKSYSTTSYKRLTKQLPAVEKWITLERTDVGKSYGFHILKSDEDSAMYNPVYVSTVELGSLAHMKGIEVGDSILTVNDEDVLSYTEKEVQEKIMIDPKKVTLGLGTRPIRPPLKSGYMAKQSSGLIKSFKKRWFELKEDNCLYYYKTEDSISPLGVVCLSNYSVVRTPEFDPVSFKLIKFNNKTYLLKCQTAADMISWADAIRQAAEAKILYPSKTSHHVNLPALQIKDPECYGFLEKRGNTSKIYRKRYCVLKEACLYYYTEQKAPTAIGVVHLHGYKCVSEFTHGRKFGFTMSPPDINMKTFQFLADTEAERKRWMSAMKTIEKWKEADGPL